MVIELLWANDFTHQKIFETVNMSSEYLGRPYNIRKTKNNDAWTLIELQKEAKTLQLTNVSRLKKEDLGDLLVAERKRRKHEQIRHQQQLNTST